MHQLIDKKKNIIKYISFLLILSTTSIKLKENQNSYSSKINQINIKGLSRTDNLKIYNELNNLFNKFLFFSDLLILPTEMISVPIPKIFIILKFL